MKELFLILFFTIFISSCTKDEGNITSEYTNLTQPVVKFNETYNVNVLSGLIYAEGLSHDSWNSTNATTMQLKADVYLPENTQENRPAILLIHGGGLDIGTRLDPNIINMANYFASRGWVAISIDYRLKGDKGTVPNSWKQYVINNFTIGTIDNIMKIYPANRDAKAALRWLYSKADEYKIDTDYITVGGGSAGAFLSIAIGTTNAEDYTNELTSIEDITLSTTNLDQPSKAHTIVDFWGGGGYVTALNQIYSLQRFDASDSPILIIHGEQDTTVDISNAEELKLRYQTTGVPYEYYPLAGFGHSAWEATVNGNSLLELAFNFIVEQQNLNVE
jgi:para-nitrobenzyl esterase